MITTTLTEFKKEYRKAPADTKINMLVILMDDIQTLSMNCTLSTNHPVAYKEFSKSLKETKMKISWLAAELKRHVEKLETRCTAMEEYLHETNEYEDFKG